MPARIGGRTEEEGKKRGERLRRRRGERERDLEIMSERTPTVCYVTQYFLSISAESCVWL